MWGKSVVQLVFLLGAVMVASAKKNGNDSVQLGVYVETYCPFSRHFVSTQLGPTYADLKDIMDVNFCAYGRSADWPSGEGYEFECQHGPEECEGNMILACAERHSDPDTFDEFAICFMSKPYVERTPFDDGESCADEVGASWTQINLCTETVEGEQLLHDKGVEFESLHPSPEAIPYITINGVDNEDAISDLHRVICDNYQGTKPPTCM